MVKLSIIIPAYNCANTIENTIKSIMKQDINDYEIVVVDDNSDDDLKNVLSKINNENIVYIKENKNYGVSHARNLGIKNAKGKYIIFLDADDEQENNMSYKLVSAMDEGYKLAYCLYYVYENNRIFKHPRRTCNIKNLEDFIKFMEINNMLKSPCNKIYLKKIIDKYNILFDENISLGEDYRFNLNYISKLESNKDIYFIDEYLYKYNRASDGLSKKKRGNRAEIKLQNINYHFKLLNNKNTDYLYYNYIKIIVAYCTQDLSILKKHEVKEQLLKINKETKVFKEKILSRILLNNFLLIRIMILFLKIKGW